MIRKMCNISGKRYGRLTAIKPVGKSPNGSHIWECICDCGKVHYANIALLNNGHITSCGCYHDEVIRKHNGTNTRLYKVYCSMIERCESKTNKSYKYYGGRGIKVCNKWRNDFNEFRIWAIANGYEEDSPKWKCTIDRIDVNGNYDPNNCRFIPMYDQASNKRNTVYLEIDGVRHHIAEWARISGTKDTTIRMRIARGKTAKEAVYGGVCYEIDSCGRCETSR